MGSTMDSKEFDLYKDIRCRTNGDIYKAFHGALCDPEDGQ